MIKKFITSIVTICFFSTFIQIPAHANAFNLPEPGTMVNLSPAYAPVMIKGVTVHKDNPFLFDFIVDIGQDKMAGEPLKQEGEKLIKYFLATLAIPEKDLWVNLSPYEKDKTVPEALGQTDMGRDLLAQDYVLKQLTASLIYPEKALGKKFWDKVYAKAHQMYGTTEVPVNTFNKVWIVADRAEVFERNQTAFVVDQHLKVMLEEDYTALSHSVIPATPKGAASLEAGIQNKTNQKDLDSRLRGNDSSKLSSQIIREIILPELEKEVNTGKNFANLRQVFNSIILASWYKKNLKQALLNQVYADQSKVKGIDLNDPTIKDQIYQQYLKAYKKGVFNYIKEESSLPLRGEGQGGGRHPTLPKKYFSGGVLATGVASDPSMTTDSTKLSHALSQSVLVSFETGLNTKATPDNAMSVPKNPQEIFAHPEKYPLKTLLVRINKEIKADSAMLSARIDGQPRTVKVKEGTKAEDLTRQIGENIQKYMVANGKNPSSELLKIHFLIARVKKNPKEQKDITPLGNQTIYMRSPDHLQIYGKQSSLSGPEILNQITQHLRSKVRVEELNRVLGYTIVERASDLKSGYEVYIEFSTDGVRAPAVVLLPEKLENALKKLLQDELLPVKLSETTFKVYRDTNQIVKIRFSEEGIVPFFSEVTPEGIVFKAYYDYGGIVEQTIAYPIMELETDYVWDIAIKDINDLLFIAGYTRSLIGIEVERIRREYQNSEAQKQAAKKIKKIQNMWAGKTDQAMAVAFQSNVNKQKTDWVQGGIDLNTSTNMQWKIRKDGKGVEMHVDQAMIQRIQREGIDWLSPVIFRITPVTSVWPLIGMEEPKKEQRLARMS